MSNMKRLRALVVSCTVLVPGVAWAQHEGHQAMSPDQIGSASVKFETSCDPAVRDDFNTAVALLHSFWFPEARKMFESIAQKDANCAMAHWGMAMSQWGNPFGGLRPVAAVEGGKPLVARAQATGTPTPRERALIDAVAILFSSAEPRTQRERVLKYEEAMQKIVADHPDDVEARIFYGLAVTQSASPTDKTYAKQIQAADILEPIFKQMPEHPGVAHYIIHAYDAPPLAERALEAARRYASLAPAVPHALHMPSHTFTRVGYWKESIETNRRSAEAARKSSGVAEELHALDYQTYAYLQIGQDAAAKSVVDRALSVVASAAGASGAVSAGAGSFAAAAIPARYALERGEWAAAASLEVFPANTPNTEAMTHFARALGAARSGNPDAATADITRLGELAAKLAAVPDPYWAEQVSIQQRIARAWQIYAQGQRDQGLTELRAAADAEDQTDKAAISPGPLAPARELLGYMLLDAGQHQDALAAFEATMKKEPNRFRGAFGAARAAELAGDRAKARTYYQQLLEIAKDADTERPEIAAAKNYVASQGR
jgi:tetratricopeptide (TPR) repeat protein